MTNDKSNPTYLLQLAEKEALDLVKELLRTDPTALSENRTLSPEQYHFLFNQTVDRLRKRNKLPVKPLDNTRFQAFEYPFYDIIRRSGLL